MSTIELARYVEKQLNMFFPDGIAVKALLSYAPDTLGRVETCFRRINNEYFRKDSQTIFHHLNSDQYAMFLYLLSNTVFQRTGDPMICTKLYLLNKFLHAIDVYYEVELPDIFLFSHSVGTVLGRAEYSNYFRVQQNCTVGGSRGSKSSSGIAYPKIGEFVSLYQGSSILGGCKIGENCKIAAHSILIDTDLPSDSIFAGNRIKNVIRPNKGPDPIWDIQ